MRLKYARREWREYKWQILSAGFFIAIGVGSLIVLATVRAATSTAAIEAESGAPSGQLSILNDATASAGKVVRFGQSSGGGETTGVWTQITMPSGFTNCEFGTVSVGVDPDRPTDLYTKSDCSEVIKSSDYGKNWAKVSTTGSADGDCGGGLSVGKSVTTGGPPALYIGCFRSPHGNFARSTNGGVSWTWSTLTDNGSGLGFYAPVIDPYDSNHLIMAGHENSVLYESSNGGVSWQKLNLRADMDGGGTAFPFFVNTGNAATTADTWLWMPQADDGGGIGLWRTTNGGTSWTRVDSLEHAHGAGQYFQPDTSGLIFAAGQFGSQGHGVYRSTNFGQSWTRVGVANEMSESNVYGTPNKVYTSFSWACAGCGGIIDPSFQSAALPGATGWTMSPPRPAGEKLGPAQVATTFDGTHYILVSANWADGIWRYVEP